MSQPSAVNVWMVKGAQQISACMGPKCMMWRWDGPPNTLRSFVCSEINALTDPGRPDHIPPHWIFSSSIPAEGEPASWHETEEEAAIRRRGHCGLAGAVAHP